MIDYIESFFSDFFREENKTCFSDDSVLFLGSSISSLSNAIVKAELANISELKNLDEADEKGNTALIYAVKLADLRAVKELLGRGASINCCNKKGYSAQTYAIKGGDDEISRLLVMAEADAMGEVDLVEVDLS